MLLLFSEFLLSVNTTRKLQYVRADTVARMNVKLDYSFQVNLNGLQRKF